VEEIMKKKAIQIYSLIALLVGLVLSAQAQINTQYRAYIPFEFNVGSETFPAGDYIIGATNPTTGWSALTIRKKTGGEANFVNIIPKQENERSMISKLLFYRYGDRYFLAEITTPTLRGEFRKSKDEKRLAKTQKPSRETVTILR
jgi:hypothetical protein